MKLYMVPPQNSNRFVKTKKIFTKTEKDIHFSSDIHFTCNCMRSFIHYSTIKIGKKKSIMLHC